MNVVKDFMRKLLQLINSFSKVAGYKSDSQKSGLSFIQMTNSLRKNMKTTPLTITSNMKYKYLGETLNMLVKDIKSSRQ